MRFAVVVARTVRVDAVAEEVFQYIHGAEGDDEDDWTSAQPEDAGNGQAQA